MAGTPAALSAHLAIGQAYAWSVFKPPLEDSLSLSGTQNALPFQFAIVMLGLSAAFGGTLVERNGPRWATSRPPKPPPLLTYGLVELSRKVTQLFTG